MAPTNLPSTQSAAAHNHRHHHVTLGIPWTTEAHCEHQSCQICSRRETKTRQDQYLLCDKFPLTSLNTPFSVPWVISTVLSLPSCRKLKVYFRSNSSVPLFRWVQGLGLSASFQLCRLCLKMKMICCQELVLTHPAAALISKESWCLGNNYSRVLATQNRRTNPWPLFGPEDLCALCFFRVADWAWMNPCFGVWHRK